MISRLASKASARAAPLRARALLRTAILATLLLPGLARAQDPDDEPVQRWLYFYEPRAFPFARVPAGALQRARLQMAARWPQLFARPSASSSLAATSVWTSIGPAPVDQGTSGRIATVAVHPTDSRIIYIGAAQGGVWKSVDGGGSWVPLTDNECSLAMGSLVIDPVNPQIVYAGTGELNFSGDSYYGCGVLRSTDGGASWTQLGAVTFDSPAGGARISRLAIDPGTAGSASGTTVMAASNVGLWRSHDSGLTWDLALGGTATDVVFDPANPAIVYAALGIAGGNAVNGVYRSTDHGITFSRLTAFPTADIGRIALAIAPSAPNILYAAVQDAINGSGNDSQLLGIWKTTDGGTTWARVTASGADCASQCWYNLVLLTDPLDPSLVYFGGVVLYRSDDGGASFRSILRNIHVDQHAIAVDPKAPATIFAGNDGGIFRSPDRGATWTSLNTNLAITQFYAGISLHPTNPSFALGGTQDNGTLEFGGNLQWTTVLGGDGGYTAVNRQDPNIAWAETQWSQNSGFSGPRRRIGGGSISALKTTGIDPSDRALFIPPLVIDRNDGNTLYFGTFRVYRTTNNGELWAPISPDMTRGQTGRVSAIAPAPGSASVIYVGTNDGNVQVSRDGGANWLLSTTGLPTRAVTDIAVDPENPAVAVLSVSGFGTGHVFRTTDFGGTWSDISANLPGDPVNAVLTDRGLGQDIYIGTDLGIFRSTDVGRSWTPFGDGLPHVAVFDLAYNSATGVALAATHGRGMFSFRPVIAAAVLLAPDTLHFASLEDTVRLHATALDTAGAVLPAAFSWSSLDPAVATVNGTGLVRSRGNGETRIVALYAGIADTARVRVDQVAVAITGVPDSLLLIAGETRAATGRAVNANGQPLAGTGLAWASSNTAVAAVDAAGAISGVGVGTALVTAVSGALRDSSVVTVAAPAVATVTAAALPATASPRGAAGTRLPMLGLHFQVAGVEAIEVTRLGFQLSGDDAGAALVVLRDANGDGAISPGDPVLARSLITLRKGTTVSLTISPSGFSVAAGGSATLLVAVELSGQAPNGAEFRATFVPAQTSSTNVRSGAHDLLILPPTPVASAIVRSTVLNTDQLLGFSENPVRSAHVIFNFAERPSRAAVYTVTGRLVIDLASRINDDGRYEWDLRNGDGELVAPGVYLVIFTVRNTVMRERLIVLRPGPAPGPESPRDAQPFFAARS